MKSGPLQTLLSLLGLELTPNNHPEKLISGLGGFVGIQLILVITVPQVGPQSAMLIVASMGASAVLLFAAPHGPLSQPWPFLAGHVLSALAGVTCQKFIPSPIIAAPASVALAIVVMYYARCIHPPGGATALTVVLGSPALHAMGYWYVVTPVLFNALILLGVAVLFNYPFPWRRYPAALVRRSRTALTSKVELSHEHLVYALRHMESLVDISESDLVEIYSLALHHAQGTHLTPEQIQVGRCYTNSSSGPNHAIRQVVAVIPSADSQQELVRYVTLTAPPPHRTEVCPRATFALWAREEVPAPDVHATDAGGSSAAA